MGSFLESTDGVVEEIMRIHRSLPVRPGLDEVEAAMAVVRNVDKEEQMRLEAISKQRKGQEVPEELFFVLQEMQRNLVFLQSKQQKREALAVLDLERSHILFDDLVQRASRCLPNSADRGGGGSTGASSTQAVSPLDVVATGAASSSSSSSIPSVRTNNVSSGKASISGRSELLFQTRDDSFVKAAKSSPFVDGIVSVEAPRLRNSALTIQPPSSDGGEKLSLIKLASLIEVSSKKGTKDLDLQGKLNDVIDWLPDSLGKLSTLLSLNLSENRIIALPTTIGGLSSLTKLDLHSNRIASLPESIGDLLSLVDLDLHGNQLSTLPPSIGKLSCLVNLDLSSNQLTFLPDTIGKLIRLKKLSIETNEIEELPFTIGQCSSLVELHADFNQLKALPEAIGKLESLEILTLHYNKIKGLPTTMASLSKLKELDVSFNELESVPESLCLSTSIVKLNLGNNFADLQYLPKSIGNLEMLEELDISNDQIRVLPDSFSMLSKLKILNADGTPLEVPPRHVCDKGAQVLHVLQTNR
ncbi:Plant intracellular Ras-group-related LRR protein 4 [Nymphaea thermarum]|nr:Plant intracellular Ras-group-related LRR protein 4 [Nymphaea thermarum]